MYYIEAPYYPNKEDYYFEWKHYKKIFLAGGITGCVNWQQEVKEKLPHGKYFLLNPRREDFPMDDPSAAHEQIKWEYEMLNEADLITYWFDDGTVQPIVLFELGRFINTDKHILIGIHPEYSRRQDVEIQAQLARPTIQFVYTLEEHIRRIRMYIELVE